MSRAPRGALYLKMAAVFIACAAGGPALMYYITPTPDELFQRFSPDLQKHSLENRERRKAEYEDFRHKMIEYSKSDKPIWVVAEEAREKAKLEILEKVRQEQRVKEGSRRGMREEMEKDG